MNLQYIKTGINERTGYITLSRAEKKNALNEQVVIELTHAFQNMFADSAVKVIQLRAEGDVFSAGADLQYLQQLQINSFEENAADSRQLARLFELIYTGPKAVIAVIQGHAIAGGCGLASICDYSISAEDAQFGYTEVKIGFVPAIVMVFLIRKLGETKARELMLTGKLISASDAVQIGLINESISKHTLYERADAVCNQLIHDASSDSIRRIKRMLAEIRHMPLTDALEYAALQNAQTRASDDCKKGISSFLNKQKTTW
jgi:methylglutaconyl-CoA hydratase